MEGKDIIQIIFFEYLLKAHFANTFMQFTDSITSHGHVGELVATVGFLSTNEVVYKYDGFVSTTNYSKIYMMLYTQNPDLSPLPRPWHNKGHSVNSKIPSRVLAFFEQEGNTSCRRRRGSTSRK